MTSEDKLVAIFFCLCAIVLIVAGGLVAFDEYDERRFQLERIKSEANCSQVNQ